MPKISDARLAFARRSDGYQHVILPLIQEMIEDKKQALEICPVEEVVIIRAVKRELESILTTIENGFKRTIKT